MRYGIGDGGNARTEILASSNIRFNLAVKRRLLKDLALDYLGIKPLGEVTLQNYGAMYRERQRSMEEPEIHPENLRLITGSRIKTDADIADILSRSKDVLTDEVLKTPPTPTAMCAVLVREVLEAHPEVKTVTNIGAFLDNICAYLAPKFPEVEFTSLDGYEDMARINSFLRQAPNWKFASGYALHMLERGDLKADLFFMTSTSVNFTHRELDRYIAAFARVAKVLVFSEPWWPIVTSLDLRIPRPEDIPPGKPGLGLTYFNYQHNYPHYLAKHGFRIWMSRVVPISTSARLQIVATR
jgi:hypothetical protein